jgi:hypothetical protein
MQHVESSVPNGLNRLGTLFLEGLKMYCASGAYLTTFNVVPLGAQ